MTSHLNLKQSGISFEVFDARTHRALWAHTAPGSISNFCYPNFDESGKTVTIIENDTLIVRDSRTGKVLLRHKNNLPAPLKSWAFTRNQNAVYLMDDKGEIFRQRLR